MQKKDIRRDIGGRRRKGQPKLFWVDNIQKDERMREKQMLGTGNWKGGVRERES